VSGYLQVGIKSSVTETDADSKVFSARYTGSHFAILATWEVEMRKIWPQFEASWGQQFERPPSQPIARCHVHLSSQLCGEALTGGLQSRLTQT
jgi:hypothetical protein